MGAARIIDIDDPRHPQVVSEHPARRAPARGARRATQKNDPGAASPVQGYAAHYCSVPTRTDPNLVACSMILSGLRIFDIRDLAHPSEVGYFNKPIAIGDKPANPERGGRLRDVPAGVGRRARDSVWYTDGNSGFYDVRLTNGLQDLL